MHNTPGLRALNTHHMNTKDITTLVQIGVLSYRNREDCRDHLLNAFRDIAITDGGDDDFADIGNGYHVAEALSQFVQPIEYCTIGSKPLSQEDYLALYLQAKKNMITLNAKERRILEHVGR